MYLNASVSVRFSSPALLWISELTFCSLLPVISEIDLAVPARVFAVHFLCRFLTLSSFSVDLGRTVSPCLLFSLLLFRAQSVLGFVCLVLVKSTVLEDGLC